MIKVVRFIILHLVDNDMQNSLKIFHKKKPIRITVLLAKSFLESKAWRKQSIETVHAFSCICLPTLNIW